MTLASDPAACAALPPPLPPDTQPCTGRGACVWGSPADNSTAECACPAPYTGRGDFVGGSLACDIFAPAVQGLYAVLLAACACCLIWTTRYWLVRVARLPKPVTGRGLFLATGMPVAWCAVVSQGSFVVVSAMRVADPYANVFAVGVEPAVTLAFAVGATAFWIGTSLFLHEFLLLNVKQSLVRSAEARSRVERLFAVLRRVFPAVAVVTVTGCFAVPLAMLGVPDTDPWARFGLAAAHYWSCALTISLYGFVLVPRLVNPIIADIHVVLESSAASPRSPQSPDVQPAPAGNSSPHPAPVGHDALRQVAADLAFFVNDLHRQSVVNVVFAALFGFWPFLQRNSSVWLPIAWMSGAIVTFNCTRALMPKRTASQGAQPSGDSGWGSSRGAGAGGAPTANAKPSGSAGGGGGSGAPGSSGRGPTTTTTSRTVAPASSYLTESADVPASRAAPAEGRVVAAASPAW